jgi:hypothetical protein
MFKKKFSPSMVVALLALFVALSGTAVAGSGLILGSSIKNGTVAASKLTPNAVKYLKGQRGIAGPAGNDGIDGAVGPAGPAGPSGGFDPAKVQIVQSDNVSIAAGGVGTANVQCPGGTTIIGGGGVDIGVGIWQDVPSGNGWQVGGQSFSSVAGYVRAYAFCAAP